MARFGLIGKTLSHSFSKTYFDKKFDNEGLSHRYDNFELTKIGELPDLIAKTQGLLGLNVTIPYKEAIIPFLDQLDPEANAIGAVNTVKINPDRTLTGYNTDHWGFTRALDECGHVNHRSALLLGTGGASKAIFHALDKAGYTVTAVSRNPKNEHVLGYHQIDKNLIERHQLIVNCTPLGTWPDTGHYPDLPYRLLGSEHLLFDLVYNPPVTRFMELGKSSGARVSNGHKMLVYQAQKAWEIWNE